MTLRRRHDFVLATYVHARAFAFVLFEGPHSPVDWGVGGVRGAKRNELCLRILTRVLERYRPDVLVVQDMSDHGTHRVCRIRGLNEMVVNLATSLSIPIYAFSRSDVQQFFAARGIATKHGIAET